MCSHDIGSIYHKQTPKNLNSLICCWCCCCLPFVRKGRGGWIYTTPGRRNFLMKFWQFQQNFPRNILVLPCLKYLCKCKLQHLNAIYNLLTKFLMEKIRHFHFFNFLICYEIQMYTGDTVWQMTLIGDVINLITWSCLKMVPGL